MSDIPRKTHHLESHEEICAVRYAVLTKQMDRIEKILYASIAFYIITMTAMVFRT